MKKNLLRFLIGFVLYLPLSGMAQDSSRIRISLLTCTPGNELYSIFGHSALRVVDSNSVTDIVYNYGTFNFGDEGFYIKFIRGKLRYYLNVERFEDFKAVYQYENRGITEQVLQLNQAEKVALQRALIENLKEENKYYQYDFFFDNCTTRLRDLITKYKSPQPHLPAVRPEQMRFREAIHEYLNKGNQQWSKWGIDVLLGARTDRVMTAAEQQFLPDNLMMALDAAKNPVVVKESLQLYEPQPAAQQKKWFTPMLTFSLLLAVFVILQVGFHKKFPLLIAGMDGLLFFLTGILGILLVFMWVATDHSMTKSNYNLLWAWPAHAVISFFISSHRAWVRQYFLWTAIGGLLLLCAWYFLPQQLNISLLPFVILLIYRAAVRYKNNE
ncbi:MAG: DUF4105 domain-containing protein [Sphingobacteriales bacterium]|nr:MAG: DUF4105 domain-containing protein [Sphingobacteriales bacterium]